jgi:outer membrane protein OmpA-like peptidoglycan-associated protein
LLRRITPGVPVRFDWGVQLPPGTIPGGTEHVEVVLGKVLFAPGSATIADRHLAAIDRMAEQVQGRHGEVIVDATGEPPALAFARASALKQALEQRLSPTDRADLEINVRNGEDSQAPLVAGWNEDGNVLGTLLFDFGQATIRPEYGALLDRMAEELERGGGGRVAIVGHTDVHGSHAYNTQLGLRRARAVFDALVQRLSPPVRAKVQVEASADPRKPLGAPQAEGRP